MKALKTNSDMSHSSSARARTLCLLAVALLIRAVTAFSIPAVADNNNLPTPEWSSVCKSPFNWCSKIEVYRYWGENPRDRLNFAVDALMNDPNNRGITTVWLLMDEPDVELAKELAKNDFNVVIIYPRGMRLSTTHYICEETKKSHDDQCWINENCAAELAAKSAKGDHLWNASHFSAEQVAHDVEFAIGNLGDGRKNVLLAQGMSSVFAMRLLQLHQDFRHGVIAMDFVHPLIFDIYGYLGGIGMDAALQGLLSLCDDDVQCVGRLGAVEGGWSRLQTLMNLAKANKLTCAKMLNWGNSKLWGSSFVDKFRSVLSFMLRYPAYPFLHSNHDLMSLIPSMLYRLQRCSDKDVKALNALYAYVTSTKWFTCPDDTYVQMLWMRNEFMQMEPPKDVGKYWSAAAKQRLALPAASNVNAFHAASKKYPTVPRTVAQKVIPANATQKILLISADVDPMAPRGAASQMALAFRHLGSTVKTLQLRGVANQPAAVLMPCLVKNLQYYRANDDWAGLEQCPLNNLKKLDFLSGPSRDFYGVDDSWEYDKPNSDDGSSGGGGSSGRHVSVIKGFFRVLLILIVIAVLGAGVIYGYNYVRDRGFRFHRVSDNFYDNLHN